VRLIAVTKAVPVERVRAALEAGIGPFGENRVREAATKFELVPGASWHLVGRLQSNKAARALEIFDQLHSLDSLDLARRLDRLAVERGRRVPLGVYLQVNVDRDPAKTGFTPEQVEQDLPSIAQLEHLDLLGLMTVGREVVQAEEARPTFVRLRELAERLRAREPRLGSGLSMGMTDDFEVAVEEGATVVRIGRAIFGERPVG
jgi:pyridoxal phosphate enzyme (YggS family)